jgi:hypothetical protein
MWDEMRCFITHQFPYLVYTSEKHLNMCPKKHIQDVYLWFNI